MHAPDPSDSPSLPPLTLPRVGSRRILLGLLQGLLLYWLYRAGLDLGWPATAPLLEGHGARILAQYVLDKSKNTFEKLPVREKEHVFVSFAAFDGAEAYDRYLKALASDARWQAMLAAHAMERGPETLRLQPTARSLVR